jgi:hypothetical protein
MTWFILGSILAGAYLGIGFGLAHLVYRISDRKLSWREWTTVMFCWPYAFWINPAI